MTILTDRGQRQDNKTVFLSSIGPTLGKWNKPSCSCAKGTEKLIIRARSLRNSNITSLLDRVMTRRNESKIDIDLDNILQPSESENEQDECDDHDHLHENPISAPRQMLRVNSVLPKSKSKPFHASLEDIHSCDRPQNGDFLSIPNRKLKASNFTEATKALPLSLATLYVTCFPRAQLGLKRPSSMEYPAALGEVQILALRKRWQKLREDTQVEVQTCNNEELKQQCRFAGWLFQRDCSMLSYAVVQRCLTKLQCGKLEGISQDSEWDLQKLREFIAWDSSDKRSVIEGKKVVEKLGISLKAAQKLFREDFETLSRRLKNSLQERKQFQEWLWSLVSGKTSRNLVVSVTERDLCALLRLVREDCIHPNNIIFDSQYLSETIIARYFHSDFCEKCGAFESDMIHSFVTAFHMDIANDADFRKGSSQVPFHDDRIPNVVGPSIISKENFMILADSLMRAYACHYEQNHNIGNYQVRSLNKRRETVTMKSAFCHTDPQYTLTKVVPRDDRLVGGYGKIACAYAVQNSAVIQNEFTAQTILRGVEGIAVPKDVLIDEDSFLLIYNNYNGGSLLEWSLANMDASFKPKSDELNVPKSVFTIKGWSKVRLADNDPSEDILLCDEYDPLLPEKVARSIFRDVLVTIAEMHKKGIAHREIRLENIMLSDEGKAVLSGFGGSMLFENGFDMFNFDHSLSNSTCYLAPEQLNNPRGCLGKKIDIWSVGVCLLWILAGRPPFPQRNAQDLFQAIATCAYVPPRRTQTSAEAIHLIGKMMSKNPDDRPSAEELLEHPWFSGESKTPKVLVRKSSVVVENHIGNTRGAANTCKRAVEAVLSSGDVHFRESEPNLNEVWRFKCLWPQYELKFYASLTKDKLPRKEELKFQVECISGRGVTFLRVANKILDLLGECIPEYVREEDIECKDFTPTSTPAAGSMGLSIKSSEFPDRREEDDLTFEAVLDGGFEIADDPFEPASSIVRRRLQSVMTVEESDEKILFRNEAVVTSPSTFRKITEFLKQGRKPKSPFDSLSPKSDPASPSPMTSTSDLYIPGIDALAGASLESYVLSSPMDGSTEDAYSPWYNPESPMDGSGRFKSSNPNKGKFRRIIGKGLIGGKYESRASVGGKDRVSNYTKLSMDFERYRLENSSPINVKAQPQSPPYRRSKRHFFTKLSTPT